MFHNSVYPYQAFSSVYIPWPGAFFMESMNWHPAGTRLDGVLTIWQWVLEAVEEQQWISNQTNNDMAFKTTHNKDESLPQFMKSPQLIFSHKNS